MGSSLNLLVEPVGLLWLGSFAGIVIAASKRQWRSAITFLILFIAVWCAGSRLSSRLLATLEQPYAGVTLDSLPSCDAVVMLGGVLKPSENGVFGIDLGDAADRAVTAAELLRRGKARTLVFGGGGGRFRRGGTWEEAALLRNWLQTWRIATTNVLALRVCANTREEAQQVRELAKEKHWERIILVTSACHMKRAEALFRHQGIATVPVPADFTASSELSMLRPGEWIPRQAGFRHLCLYLHEKIGWHYYSLRGWIEK
jgi:uncharacterized SAM-binding protein YcdF (DUF218 family)